MIVRRPALQIPAPMSPTTVRTRYDLRGDGAQANNRSPGTVGTTGYRPREPQRTTYSSSYQALNPRA